MISCVTVTRSRGKKESERKMLHHQLQLMIRGPDTDLNSRLGKRGREVFKMRETILDEGEILLLSPLVLSE